MIQLIPKNENKSFATDFKGKVILDHAEFRCKCHNKRCQYSIISNILIEKFRLLRFVTGDNPIQITSGFRCTTHNLAEGGGKLSQHQIGFALDMACPGDMRLEDFETMALLVGFTYTKIYKDSNILHADVRGLD